MSAEKSDFRLAVEPILVLAASAVSSVAGYSMAVAILHDGERAVVGLFWGATAFALSAWLLVLLFRKPYRARGGSPWLVVMAAAVLPTIMLLGRVL